MSDPHASSEESLRERLRGAADEARRLSAEKARLERELAAGSTSRGWIAGIVVSMVVAGLGFGASAVMTTQRAARLRQLEEEQARLELAFEQTKLRDCQQKEIALKRELQACTPHRPLGRSPSNPLDPAPRPRPGQPCACQPGDPLCSCL
jgi:hypothetical protein